MMTGHFGVFRICVKNKTFIELGCKVFIIAIDSKNGMIFLFVH